MEQLAHIPLRKIDWDPRFQVRLQWDPTADAGLTSLAASLAGSEGLIHPVVVARLPEATTFGHTYALIAGHRRLAAARRLRWETILARVLPPCDLAAPQHQLHLLAIAVRENTEREDLAPADRRAALRRLEALYAAVHPETTQPGRRGGSRGGASASRPEPFPRWAAKVTHIPEHTIRRDVRCMLFTGGSLPTVQAAPPASPMAAIPEPSLPPMEALHDRVQHSIQASQYATAALQTFATAFTPEARADLSDVQFTTLHQTLETLQAAVTGVWPVVRMQTEHPLVPFALVAQEQVAALRGALWGLRTGSADAWATLPPTVARALHTAIATLLTEWQEVAPLLHARLPGVAVDTAPIPSPPVWGRSVAVA
jgi:hypothetical protein